MELQAMLLRVLESGETQPVGAGTTSRVDVRVLVATDENLNKAIDEGRFRAPLFYRLSASQVEVPPLRERKDDIGRLLIHFLRYELTAADLVEKLEPSEGNKAPWLPPRLVARLAGYFWPGNVRQLHNTVRQMVIAYGDSDSVDTAELMSKLEVKDGKTKSAAEPGQAARRDSSPRPAEIGEEDLVAAMRANRFSIKSTAEALGISRSSLYALIERSQRVRKARDIDLQEMQACQGECGGDLDAMADCLEVSKKALKLRLKELGLD